MPTILIVDDEPGIISTLRTAIGRGIPGARILTAADGDAGLAQLAIERVDLVCSDYKMPGMTGLDLLVKARERAPKIARVLLTAYPDDSMAIRAINEAKLDHFFVKPVRMGELVAKFQELLDEATRREQASAAFARSFHLLRQRAEEVATITARA